MVVKNIPHTALLFQWTFHIHGGLNTVVFFWDQKNVAFSQEEFLTVPVRKGKSKSNTLVDRLTQFMDRRVRATGCREFREQDLKTMAGNVETKDWDKA